MASLASLRSAIERLKAQIQVRTRPVFRIIETDRDETSSEFEQRVAEERRKASAGTILFLLDGSGTRP